MTSRGSLRRNVCSVPKLADEKMRTMRSPEAASPPYELPPLILHPFTEGSDPETLVRSTRASLLLQGLLPGKELNRQELERLVLAGRYCEIRMLIYIGKDIFRWVDQCLEWLQNQPRTAGLELGFPAIARLLIEDTPAAVDNKLRSWGVVDYKAIFRRAIGLRSLFSEPPPQEVLEAEFIRSYHRYADHAYQARLEGESCPRLDPQQYTFVLYASGEYARLLEQQWQCEQDDEDFEG